MTASETDSETAAPPLTLKLFGSMQVFVQGQALPRLRSQKALWLLALLALRSESPVQREWVAGLLWPDSDPSRAFSNLRVVLSELKKALGSEGERLQANVLTLFLDITGAEIDVVAFDTKIKSADPAELEQAAALYQGPLLEGCSEEWVPQERRIREQNCVQALQTLADTALAAQEYAAAAVYYQRVVRIAPRREAAQRGWMEALSKNGDHNAALQVYRNFLNALKSDPTAVPDPQTSALYTRLRAEARQRVDISVSSGAKESAGSVVSGYLPRPLTALVGREDERIEVAALLRHSRLVTLTGPGGIGKTRLASDVAAEIVSEYADGVWLVALEALSEGSLAASQIASILGVKEETGQSFLQSITAHLRSKRLLLVLDNCEHLLDACAQIAGYILRECAAVRILATSREALGITGEVVWSVPSLSVPDPEHLPQSRATLLRVLKGYDSVQLFVERAEAAQKTFMLNSNNARAVAQVCAQLEGIPLAIELAAARVETMPVEQIASRLYNYLDLLTGGIRIAQSRQRTLRATLDWSHALLDERERLLLWRLAVFAGGWSLDAAEAVCAIEGIEGWQVLDLLTSLVSKSLVVFEEWEQGTGGRYRLLELVQAYAREQLQASGEMPQIKNRHRDWFIALAEKEKLSGAEAEQSLRRLEAEYDNLRTALAHCGEDPQDAEAGLRLAGALLGYWNVRGHYREGQRFLEEALQREQSQARTITRAKALKGAGVLAISQGNYALAQTFLEESLSICRELGDKSGISVATGNLGNIAYRHGEYAAAQSLYEESLKLYREQGNSLGIARAINSLGLVASSQGEYALAQSLYEESLSLRRELGDVPGIAVATNNLGNIASGRGDYTSAWALHAESLSLCRQLEDRHGIAAALFHLSRVAFYQGDYASAETLGEESHSLSREVGDKLGITRALSSLGIVAQAKSNYRSAEAFYEESLRLYRDLGEKRGAAYVINNLGKLAYEQGKFVEARTLCVEGLKNRIAMKEKSGMVESLENLSVVLLAQNKVVQFARLSGAAQALRETLGTLPSLKEREQYGRLAEQARTAVGDTLFTAAWEEGKRLSWEEAAAYALAVE